MPGKADFNTCNATAMQLQCNCNETKEAGLLGFNFGIKTEEEGEEEKNTDF